jgi:hypothetical protein
LSVWVVLVSVGDRGELAGGVGVPSFRSGLNRTRTTKPGLRAGCVGERRDRVLGRQRPALPDSLLMRPATRPQRWSDAEEQHLRRSMDDNE